MRIKIYSFILALGMLSFSSCDLNLLDDPNAVTRDTASPDFILNRIQVDFALFFNRTSNWGMRITRQLGQPSDQYANFYTPSEPNLTWTGAYADILNDINLLLPIVEEANFRRHAGIAKTIRAYVLMTMVDYFGDIPLSEALDQTNFNPNVDNGADVYAAALADLQAAKEDFAAQSLGAPTDLFYAGNAARWTRLINALQLKYHLSRRLVDPSGSLSGINALIAEGNLPGAGDDFVFTYGTNLTDPDSRHPRFAGTYTAGGGDYQATWFMFHLTEAKGFDDPRARYYLYRQRLVNPDDPDELRCISEFAPAHYQIGGWPFCLPGERGYWGRDHLNNEGIPPDNLARTVWGLYPAGGRFDNDSGAPVNNPQLGNRGAGIQPIMLAGFVDFMLAEAALELGATGDPKAYLLSGIRKQMNYVRSYALSSAEAGAIDNFEVAGDFAGRVDGYIAFVDDAYDRAPAARKMSVIGREYWLALYGNGNEAYNLYRRTGQPDNMQPGLLPDPGIFPRSLLYPLDFMTTNSNATQKPNLGVKVFWDNNPDGFIY